MKVLLVCERLQGYGGWYTYARDLRDGLRDRGHTVVTCTVCNAPEGDHPVLPRPLEVFGNPWRAFTTSLALRRIIAKEKPDVVHIVVEPYALCVPFLPASVREKIVLTVHGSYGVRPLQTRGNRILAKSYYKHIPKFITVSNYTKDHVAKEIMKTDKKLGDRFQDKAHIIRNAVRLPPELPHRAKNDVHSVLLVGGVKPRKGVLEALDAVADYRTTYGKPIRLTIVGNRDSHDSYVKNVDAKILALGLKDHVEMTGMVEDAELERLYHHADLLLVPSRTSGHTFEGFGLTYLEAAARGIPSIGPNSAGVREAIAEGESGYLIDPVDPDMISEKMHQILDKHAIKRDRCRAWAEKHTVERLAREVEAVYVLQNART